MSRSPIFHSRRAHWLPGKMPLPPWERSLRALARALARVLVRPFSRFLGPVSWRDGGKTQALSGSPAFRLRWSQPLPGRVPLWCWLRGQGVDPAQGRWSVFALPFWRGPHSPRLPSVPGPERALPVFPRPVRRLPVQAKGTPEFWSGASAGHRQRRCHALWVRQVSPVFPVPFSVRRLGLVQCGYRRREFPPYWGQPQGRALWRVYPELWVQTPLFLQKGLFPQKQ